MHQNDDGQNTFHMSEVCGREARTHTQRVAISGSYRKWAPLSETFCHFLRNLWDIVHACDHCDTAQRGVWTMVSTYSRILSESIYFIPFSVEFRKIYCGGEAFLKGHIMPLKFPAQIRSLWLHMFMHLMNPQPHNTLYWGPSYVVKWWFSMS